MYKRSNQPKPSLMKYPTLYELLKDFTAIKGDKITHTRIGDKRLNVYGGSYSIPEDKEITDEFYHHYFHHVFVSKKQEYLTEVQIDCPPVLVDLDFRYSPEIEDRQHNTEHINKLVCLYLKTIGELFHVEDSQVKVFIMEKPDVNMLEDKTKDGIHLIIGYCLTHQQQTLIRKHVLKTIGDVLGDLPLINSFEDVLDEGISKGHTNWNVFGSRKPAHQAYALTHVYNATYNEEGFELDELNVSTLYDGSDANNKKLKKYMRMCSAKYSGFDKLEITPAYKQELENMTLKKQKDKPLKASQHETTTDKQTEKFWDYAELLKDEEMTSYEGWFRFTCLHKNILGDSDYERFDEFCSKYSGYDDEKNRTTYESLERRETPTWGTLYYLASQNEDKKEEKSEIDNKWDTIPDDVIPVSEDLQTDEGLANLLYIHFGKEFIFYDKTFYHYNGVYWRKDPIHATVHKKLAKDIYQLLDQQQTIIEQVIMNETRNNRDTTKHHKQLSIVKLCKTRVHQTPQVVNIVKAFTKYVYKDEKHTWERNKSKIVFENGVYDLDANKFEETGDPEEYMYFTTGFNYEKRDEDKITKLEKILKMIHTEEDVNRFYKVILSTCLIGETYEKFIVANGCGANGKGVLHELLMELMGDYGYTASNSVLLQPIGDKNNPSVASMNNKRFIIYREPDAKQRLNIGTMKELTGGDSINARMNYSNNTECKLKGTHILECNQRLNLDGRVDHSVIRRLYDIHFGSTFTTDETQWNEEDRIFEANSYYKSVQFKKDYKMSLFHILADTYHQFMKKYKSFDKLKVPKSVIQSTKEYLINTDNIHSWFEETYTKDKEGSTSFIPIKEVYEKFKDSDQWLYLSNSQKRKFTLKYFKSEIQHNYYIGKSYKLRYKFYDSNGDRKETRNVIIGYILNTEGDTIDDIQEI